MYLDSFWCSGILCKISHQKCNHVLKVKINETAVINYVTSKFRFIKVIRVIIKGHLNKFIGSICGENLQYLFE